MANSKPWGGAGAWAAEAERAEEEAKERQAAAAADVHDYPSLSEALSAKPKKKNKGQTISLAQLQSGQNVGLGARTRGGGASETKGLTAEELAVLPTGPRERTAEEDSRGGLGGGFRDYGRSNRFENRDRGDRGSRGYGGFDDERKQTTDRDMPSRADESDNWGTMKKSMPPPGDQFERRRFDGDRYEGIGGGGGSRADEADNWGTGKKSAFSAAPPDRRSMGFGSSYREPGMDADRWGKKESYRDERPGDRPRLVLNPPRNASDPVSSQVVDEGAPKSVKPNPFGLARPREEVLAEKNIDFKKLDSEFDSKAEGKYPSRPSSSHSSRPGSAESKSEVATKPRPKINPFGDAKPRELLLAERGEDYRKIDFELEHRRVDRPETEEEIKLKEEINALKDQAKETGTEEHVVNGETSEGDQLTLAEKILKKEKELELLIRDFDDKVRFVKRVGERPISATGRSLEAFDRPSSQSGRTDSGNSFESYGRPRSRGAEGGGPDVWRSGEERRGMFGGGNRDRFFSNRERYDNSLVISLLQIGS
ncbi:hypothetical protein KI387_024233 [Taxus chinensis]|uniref:Eukaryotic translation initiation factor 4B n=1 Tax=Taxus chinensis TaxID=29808 RepID=A0AA38L8Q4_TAXCH|nr:hypothetical protein KI387_024233 [Taxus chinensis]